MDFSKMETSDWLIGGGGIALFIFSFFSWFGYDESFISYSESGWSNVFSMLGILLSIAVTGTLLANKLGGVELPDIGGVSWDQLWFFVSVGAAVLILLQLLIGASVGGFDLDRKFGIFLGVLAVAAQAAGGFLKFQAAGSSGTSSPGASGPPQSF